MKRLGMIAVLGGLLGLWVVPAAAPAAGLSGGLKLGINTAFILGRDVSDFPYYDSDWLLRFGFCGGGFVTIDLSESVSIQAEGLLTRKGSSQVNLSFDYPTYRYSLVIDYLEVPLLIRLLTSPRSRSGFFLQAGPAMGFKLGGGLKRDGETYPPVGIKSTDMGIVYGIGWLKKSGIVSELRYTMGLTKIVEIAGAPLDIKNGVLSLTFGYVF